ncbi:MAG: hypothetical protein HRS57_00755 [Mycoplasmataceae bacterium]|nr:hypothetical protein [Mycoplasmataceae bacterium]
MDETTKKNLNKKRNNLKAIDDLLNVVNDQWKMKCISNAEKNYTQDKKRKDIEFLDKMIEAHNKNFSNKILANKKSNSIVEDLIYKENLLAKSKNDLNIKKQDWLSKKNSLCDFCAKNIYNNNLDKTSIHILNPASLDLKENSDASIICNDCELLIHQIFSFNDLKWLTKERQREFILFIKNLDIDKVDRILIDNNQIKENDTYLLKKPIEKNLKRAFILDDESKMITLKNKLLNIGLTKKYVDDLMQEIEGYDIIFKNERD